jgi:DNA-binding GntR family transcriptional regulator
LAHDQIRQLIISGEFAMGERLVESQLANDLETSRAPIREALQRLAKEGLVDERPHQGTFVVTLSAEDVSEMYNVRLGLETTGLRLFMKQGSATRPLREAIEMMEKAAAKGDRPGVVAAEFEFHRRLALGAQNNVLSGLFTDLEGRVMMAMALDDASFENLHEVAAEHVPVVEAIEGGDEQLAVAVFEHHLVSTVGQALERLGGDTASLLTPLNPSLLPK